MAINYFTQDPLLVIGVFIVGFYFAYRIIEIIFLIKKTKEDYDPNKKVKLLFLTTTQNRAAELLLLAFIGSCVIVWLIIRGDM